MGNTVDPNSQTQIEERPALVTYEDVASRLELTLTRPDLHEDAVYDACQKALAAGLAAVVVRPSDLDMAVRTLAGTSVAVASMAGFPHGSSNTATKLYEGRDNLRRGAKEVTLVVNYGKMISRQFQHVETEILQMSESCHQNEAIFNILFESSFFGEDLKNIICKMAKRTDADYLETNAMASLPQLTAICKDVVKLKLSGPGTLDGFRAAYAAGCERYASPGALTIAAEWKRLLTEQEEAAKKAAAQTS
jgi:deoxyribose-phosphate aldolase